MLCYKWNPINKARGSLVATVNGDRKKIVTCSVQVCHAFVNLMQTIVNEAIEGYFSTQEEFTRRREELLPQFVTPAEELVGTVKETPQGTPD